MVVEILSRYVGISNHHVVLLKYITILSANYTSVNQGGGKKLGIVSLLTLIFPFKIVLAIMHPLNFHINFRISLTIYAKEEAGILTGTMLNP